MISKVRTYINQAIASVDSNLVELNEFYTNDVNVPENHSKGCYIITYAIPSMEQLQSFVSQSITVDATFYFDTYRSKTNAFDNAMEKVNNIIIAAINKKTIEQFSTSDENKILNVIPLSQSVDTGIDNTRQVVITASFEMKINTTIC